MVNEIVSSKLESIIKLHEFPESSIPHASINFKGLTLSGDHIKAGIIENFGSNGIEDRSTFVQLTLMDHASAFEGPVWAPEVQVKGNLTVDGNLIIHGDVDATSPAFIKLVEHSRDEVKKSLNEELFKSYSDIIFKSIRDQGIDLDRLTQAGKEVIAGNKLGYHITDTNIQRVGILHDLQTKGENLLSNTLYVTDSRVGVNTMDPSATFVIWDEEVEMLVTKRRQDTGYIGTARFQKLIVGSNNKENIMLNTDGSVEINKLSIGKVQMISALNIPNYEGHRGDIVWNEIPDHGTPIGWVCLGSTRWAKFGTVD